MKRLSAFLITTMLLSFCATFSACAQTKQQEPDSIRIGITIYDEYDTFIGELMKCFSDYVLQMEQEEGIAIQVLKESADGNQSTQNNQVESFIEAGCDIICVNLVDRADASVIITQAITADIPLIFFNRELVEDDLYQSDNFYYVGAEAQESGKMQGEIVAQLFREQESSIDKNGDGVLQYVMLEGEAGHQDAIVRTESALQETARQGLQLQRLEGEIANWVRSQAETKMLKWLEVHGTSIELVFANNDDMALGAIDALKQSQVPKEDWPFIVGIDGTPIGLEAVAAGELSGTVYNDAKGQAEGMLQLACSLIRSTPMPSLQDGKYLRTPYEIITPDNVASYLTQHSADDDLSLPG